MKTKTIIFLAILIISGLIYHQKVVREMQDAINYNRDEAYGMWSNFTNCANDPIGYYLNSGIYNTNPSSGHSRYSKEEMLNFQKQINDLVKL